MPRFSERRLMLKMALSGLAAAGVSSIPAARLAARESQEGEALDCVIVGGGVSGLTAGWKLRDRNILVLEAADYAGGRAIGGQHNGWHYPKGTEYLGAAEGIFAEMIQALGLEFHQIPAPMDTTYRNGSFYKGSGQKTAMLIENGGRGVYNDFLDTLSAIAQDYAPVPDHDVKGPLARLDTITCRAWFEELGLPQIYHDTYDVMSRGLFGATIDEVSALGAFEEIAFDFEGAARIRDREEVEELKRELSPSGSYTFAHGIAQFTTALGRALGDKLRLSAQVSSITGNDEDGYVVTYTTPDGEFEVEADSVILATPTPISTAIGAAVLSPEQKDILNAVPYAPYVTVAVFSDEPVYDGGFDLALPGESFFTDLYDCTWVQRRVDPEAKAYPGYVASFYVAPRSYKDHSIMSMSDEDLLTRCKQDLERIFPGRAARIKGFDVHRHPYAYPVPVVGQFERLMRLHATLGGGLQLAGDGVNYPTFQTAIMAGEIAADRVLDYVAD